jgi:D-aminoacyl-tRNA deacylase
MRACVQRVSEARVIVAGEIVGQIGRGLVVLLGVAAGDSSGDVDYIADKIAELRIFPDEAGKMNRSLEETGGAMLVVSQFTLLGDCRKGRRPSFIDAAEPSLGERLYEEFVQAVAAKGIEIATGRFRQHMDVTLTNDGPVTLLIDSKKVF